MSTATCMDFGRQIYSLLMIVVVMEKETVLKSMKEAGKPVSAGEVATLTGLDKKIVDKVFAELKKEGAIISPVRCKWTPAE